MTLFNIVVNSKNKTLMHNFLSFFKKYLTYNPIILAKYLNKNAHTKTITLLKSPHAHKSSQEHFKNRMFRECLKIKAKKNLKLLFFLKGLSSKMFPSSNFKIKHLLNNNRLSKNHFNIINLNNFSIRLLSYKTIKTKNFQLKIGLNFFKKNLALTSMISKKITLALSILQLDSCLNSSVGLERRTENPWVSSSILLLNNQTMQNDLSNMFTSIQNGQIAKLRFILQSRKKTCETLLKILWKEGYILGYQVLSTNSNYLKIFLKYNDDKSVVNCIKNLSNPYRGLFYCVKGLWKITDNNSLIIVITSKGIKSITGSKRLQIGGRPFIIIN